MGVNSIAEQLLLDEEAVNLPSGHGKLIAPNPLLLDQLPPGLQVVKSRVYDHDLERWYRAEGVKLAKPGVVIHDTGGYGAVERRALYGHIGDLQKLKEWWKQFSHIGSFIISGDDAYQAIAGMPHVTVVKELALADVKQGSPVIMGSSWNRGIKDRVYAHKQDLPALRQAVKQTKVKRKDRRLDAVEAALAGAVEHFHTRGPFTKAELLGHEADAHASKLLDPLLHEAGFKDKWIYAGGTGVAVWYLPTRTATARGDDLPDL
jgi:hypothetical protein